MDAISRERLLSWSPHLDSDDSMVLDSKMYDVEEAMYSVKTDRDQQSARRHVLDLRTSFGRSNAVLFAITYNLV